MTNSYNLTRSAPDYGRYTLSDSRAKTATATAAATATKAIR